VRLGKNPERTLAHLSASERGAGSGSPKAFPCWNPAASRLVRQRAVLIWDVKAPAVFQAFYGVFAH